MAITLSGDGITRANLAADVIDSTKLADDAVNSEHLADGSIDAVHLSANSVDSDAYVDASIDNAHLADDAVGVAELSATGTASSSTFLRGDNTWATAGTTYAGIDDQSSSNDDQLTIKDSEVVINEDSDDVDFRVESNNNANTLFVEGSSDNVGIGYQFPEFPLTVQTDKNCITGTDVDVSEISLKIQNPNNDTDEAVGLGFGISTTTASVGGAIIFERTAGSTAGDMHFATKPSGSGATDNIPIRMTISDLGTISMRQRSGSGSNCAIIRTASNGSGTYAVGNGIQVGTYGNGTNTDDWAYIADVGYGQVLSSRFRGTHIGGIGNWSTTTTFNTSSDYRLKENEVPMTGAITRLKELKPYRFNWKIEPGIDVDGFYAHEAATVVPESVTGEKDAVIPAVLWYETDIMYSESDQEVIDGLRTTSDIKIPADSASDLPEGKNFGDVREPEKISPQVIDHSKFVPLLTGALQEAITKIETLEAKVEALENP
jgi:hypothetical protein